MGTMESAKKDGDPRYIVEERHDRKPDHKRIETEDGAKRNIEQRPDKEKGVVPDVEDLEEVSECVFQ